MTSKVVEVKIILLIWLFSASVVSFSTMSVALTIHSDASELTGINLAEGEGTVGQQDSYNSSEVSAGGGDR